MTLLHADFLGALDRHAAAFAGAQPFRHVVVDGFFAPTVAAELAAAFPAFDPARARNELGVVGNKCVHENVRELGPAWQRLDAFLQTPAFLGAIERLTGIAGLRYDADYYGGGTHENRSGQGLHPHVDFNYHPRTGQHRRLNLIVYLNEQWDPAWGGSIQLWRDPWDRTAGPAQTVAPLWNRAVLFETNERSWHGFPVLHRDAEGRPVARRSFALYLYTDDRPAAETAPSHQTFYVHAPLPEHFAAGRTLSADDVAALRAMLQERDDWIRYLYGREKKFAGTIDSLRDAARAHEQRQAELQAKLWRGPSGWARRLAKVVAPLGSGRRRLLDRLLGIAPRPPAT